MNERRPVTRTREVPSSAALLTLVQQRAAVILAEAREAADGVRQQAYQAGYQAGREEGRRAAEVQVVASYQAALDEVQQAALLQEQQVRDWFLQAEPGIVDLVMEVASRVVRRQTENDRRIAVDQVLAALDAMGNAAWAHVRVNPIDLPAVETSVTAAGAAARTPDFQVRADASIEPGGCVVEGPGACVDATPGAQVANMRAMLARAS